MTYHVKAALLALAAALPTRALADWNGAYVGFSLGANTTNELSADGERFEADSSTAFGVFGGYATQNNDFVFGGEVAFLRAPDLEFKADEQLEFEGDEQEVTLDYGIFDLKGRAGYVVNDILFYGVAGFSRITIIEGDADATGFNFGVGADYDLGTNFGIGVEYLARRTDLEGLDVNLDTLALRAAYKF